MLPRYWTSGNEAEVDFLVQYKNEILPVEVKSDENVRSRSLTVYAKKHQPQLAMKYSLKNLSYREGLLTIPHFMADFTTKLLSLVNPNSNQ